MIVKVYDYRHSCVTFYFNSGRDLWLPDEVLTAFEENTMWQEYFDRKELDEITERRYSGGHRSLDT